MTAYRRKNGHLEDNFLCKNVSFEDSRPSFNLEVSGGGRRHLLPGGVVDGDVQSGLLDVHLHLVPPKVLGQHRDLHHVLGLKELVPVLRLRFTCLTAAAGRPGGCGGRFPLHQGTWVVCLASAK